jgi:hypothetical protein
MLRVLVCLLLFALPLAQAEQSPRGLSFSATLDSIKVNARPQQVITRQFRLTLDANQPETHFIAHVEDWWRSEDGKQSFYAAPGTLTHSCAKWVTLNPVESAVKPGDTLVVRITATVPVELPGGGYWCALTVDELPNPLVGASGVGVRFVASVSTGIFIYVDPVRRSATIQDLQVRAGEALVRVRNDGNSPLGIEGHIEFYAPGATAATATSVLPRSTLLTEPSVEGVVSVMLPPAAVLPSGHYLVRAILDFGADHYIGAEREIDIVRGVQPSGRIR